MSINLYGGRGVGPVSRGLARATQGAIETAMARGEVGQAELFVSAALFNQGETDVVNAVIKTKNDIQSVPEAGAYLEPLLRQYGTTVGFIIRRGSGQ